MRRLLFALMLAAATSASAQVQTQGLPARFIAAFPGTGVEATAILGEFCKTAAEVGDTITLVCQNDSETEYTVEFDVGGGSGGGASIDVGTADPTGGSDGDAYIQVDGSDEIQALWTNASGTWEEYTLPAGPAGAAGPAGPAGPAGTDGAGTALSDATQTRWSEVAGLRVPAPTLRAGTTSTTWPTVLSRSRRFRMEAFTPRRSRITRSRPPRFQTKESVMSSSGHL